MQQYAAYLTTIRPNQEYVRINLNYFLIEQPSALTMLDRSRNYANCGITKPADIPAWLTMKY